MSRIFLSVLCFFCLAFTISNVQVQSHQWTSLDGPKWVSGKSVAYGMGGLQQAWHRYMIGSDETDTKLFYWREADTKWRAWANLSGAVNVTSYNANLVPENKGNVAYCTRYNDRVYYTENGGEDWDFIQEHPDNQKYTTLEIDEHPTGEFTEVVYVGCEADGVSPTTYQMTFDDQQWVVNPIDGLAGINVNDLDYNFNAIRDLYAAAGDGLYRSVGGTDDWILAHQDFDGVEFTAIASLNYHNEMWAATDIMDGDRRLFYTYSEPSWVQYEEVEINNGPFDKDVNEMIAIEFYGFDTYQSVYIAAQDGLYLLDVEGASNGITIRRFIDFKEESVFYVNSPFAVDYPILSVDYYQESREALTREIIVSTANHVYLVMEIRQGDERELAQITFTDITDGTHRQNVSDLTFIDNDYYEHTNILTASTSKQVEKGSFDNWELTATTPAYSSDYVSTDIASERVSTTDGFALVSYKLDISPFTDGAILYSEDMGGTWSSSEPWYFDRPILTVEFDPHNDNAYAGCYGWMIFNSDCNGNCWATDFPELPEIVYTNDILTDPVPNDRIYIAGSIIYNCAIRVIAWDPIENEWVFIEEGFIIYPYEVQHVRQLCKGTNDNMLYAATDIGIFKADVSDLSNVQWVRKTDGINNPSFNSIVIDPDDDLTLFASTAGEYPNQKVYVSADSGRSWIDCTGQIVQDEATVNELAFAQNGETGLVAGTNKGVYYLPDIVFSGLITSNESWGPGTVIINGEIWVNPGVTLTIAANTTVLIEYDFEGEEFGILPIYVDGTLNANGLSGQPVIFESSRPTNPQPGDWKGIYVREGGVINLNTCEIYHAEDAITALDESEITLSNCKVSDSENSGVSCVYPTIVSITGTDFHNNNLYAISVINALEEATFEGITIEGDHHDGIRYFGDAYNFATPWFNNLTITTNFLEEGFGIQVGRDQPEDMPATYMSNVDISTFKIGLWLDRVIEGTLLDGGIACHNNGYGMILDKANVEIIGSQQNPNYFIDNPEINLCGLGEVGLTVRYSKFSGSTEGVGLETSEGPGIDFGQEEEREWGNNWFEDNQMYDLWVYDCGQEVWALMNWWGDENGPDPNKVAECVIWDPFLEEPPPYGFGKVLVDGVSLPKELALSSSYPNPFNLNTKIEFAIPNQGMVTLKIHNILGQEIRQLYNQETQPGYHSVVWDGKNNTGNVVSSGVYLYSLQTSEKIITKKMVLLK